MKVTDFQRTKQGRISIFADGVFVRSVHPDVLVASGLSIGSELDEQRLGALADADELRRAKDKALRLLSYQPYTSGQLRERLMRQTDEHTAQAAVQRMQELGLLDDAGYAMRYARELATRKHFAPARIRLELRRRGLSQEHIEAALETLECDPEEEMRVILEKKYPLALEDEKIKRRAFAALLRMGYAPSQVRRVLCVSQWE